jgi:uncharacterized protein (DUF885 family)
MILNRPFIIAALLIGLCSSPIILAQGSKAEEQLQKLGQEYVQLQLTWDPVHATYMGEHDGDKEYPDFSNRSTDRTVRELKSLRGKLHKVDEASLSTDAQIDYLLLESNLTEDIESLSKSLLFKDNPKLFSSTAIDGVYSLLISPSLTDEEKFDRIMARVKKLPSFLEQARKRFKEPPAIWVLLAAQEAETGSDFLNDVAAHFSELYPDKQEEVESAFSDATNALLDFQDFLGNFRDRAGQPFAIGRAEYNRRLKQVYFVDFDVDSLQKLGEALFEDLDQRYDSLSNVISALPPDRDYDIFVPKSFNRQDILDYFQWEINKTRDWVKDHDFATIPPEVGKCVPVETPKFLRNIIGGVAYQPAGPFETRQIGRFYVQPLPDSLDDADRSAFFRYCYKRGFRTSVVHEAYPGHHLQLQLANNHPSLIRRIQQNSMMAEGWALYCEEAMFKAGFYEDDPRIQLKVIAGQRFRAARIIVDTKLQTGQFTYQQAIDWMMENLNMPMDFVETEVSRYTLTPLQPMTYLIGKLEIEQIRDAFARKMGADYSLKRFHDMILSEGTIPPMLIYRKINQQIL